MFADFYTNRTSSAARQTHSEEAQVSANGVRADKDTANSSEMQENVWKNGADPYTKTNQMKLPRNIEQYKDFDEQEDYSNFADEQSTQNEHDTTRESTETCGSREILSEEQPSATPGEGTAGEGQQGGTLQGDVQGDAQEGLARAEAGQEVADK